MQAYMKSALPYYGVRVPCGAQHCPDDLHAVARSRSATRGTRPSGLLYDDATHREERYAALALVGHRLYSGYADVAAMPLYEHLVTTGAWWDLVDEASHRVGDALRADRAGVTAELDRWIAADSLWMRRSSIICQVGHRADTDLGLLAAGGCGECRRPRLLHPEGDRLGAARRVGNEPRLGARLRRRAPRGTVTAVGS